ncbi:hypothetical protein Hanom_Chr11g01053251 [Helianthus anomalus]
MYICIKWKKQIQVSHVDSNQLRFIGNLKSITRICSGFSLPATTHSSDSVSVL